MKLVGMILICLGLLFTGSMALEPKHIISVPEHLLSDDDEAIHLYQGRAYTIVDDGQYRRYQRLMGFRHHFTRPDHTEILSVNGRKRAPKSYKLPGGGPVMSTKIPPGYHRLEQINQILFDTQKAYPKLAQVEDIAKKYGNGTSVEGRPIYGIKLSHDLKQDMKPAILIASAHHCREVITPEIALDVIQRLTSQFGQDDFITKILTTYTVYIVPVVNVDGLAYVWSTNNWWRKNRRRTSATTWGVDLNRQYPLGWKACGGSDDKTSEIYKGPAILSEPEVQAVVGLHKAFNFAKVMDFHSSGREVLNQYKCRPMPSNMKDTITKLGEELAHFAEYDTRAPSSDGEHQEFAIMNHTSYSFLVETGTEFQPPYSDCQSEIKRVWPLIHKFFEKPIPFKGFAIDATNLKPVSCVIEMKGVQWQSGEVRHTRPSTGMWHYWPPMGAKSHVLVFHAAGYHPTTVTLQGDHSTKNIFVSMKRLQQE